MCVASTIVMEEDKGRDARGRALVQVLAFVLDKMVAANSNHPQENSPITKFHALRPPQIGIEDYLLRISRYASCSPECFVLSLVYIDRLIQRHNFVLSSLNVHRVIITSIVLAAKFFDDQYFNNAYYARVGGVPCAEMNSLELEFLFLTNFSLHVSPEDYAKYYNELANHYVFSNALHNFVSMPPHIQQIRHYIAEDPHQNDQLVYITQAVHDDVSYVDSDAISIKSENVYRSSRRVDRKNRSVMALGVNA